VDHVCLVFPILPGKTGDARDFQRDLDTTRKPDYARSEQRIGVTREYWYLASLPSGDHLVAYFDVADANQMFATFVQSRDDFDMWFKRRLNDVTGIDFNKPPADMKLPELVSTYEA
jgi:hypothetical protein